MTRLALIGFGAWGPNYLKTIDAMEGVEVSFICRRDVSKIPENVRRRVKVSEDYKDAIQDEIDGAIIATPPSSHREISLFFLENGIPTILEKPVAETYEDASFIMDASSALDVPILVNNIHLFSSHFVALKDIISQWDNFQIRSKGGNHGPYRDYSSLIDYGPHDVSMILSIFRRYPDEVSIEEYKSMGGYIYDIKMKFGKSTAQAVVGNGMSEKRRSFVVSDGSMNVTYDGKLTINRRIFEITEKSPLEEFISVFICYLKDKVVDWRFNPSLNRDVMKILSV